MYLSNNYDVDSQIILDLPFNDLLNFCAINNYTNKFYHCNKLLHHKFNTINKIINDNVKDFFIDNMYCVKELTITLGRSNKLLYFENIINKYNIKYIDKDLYHKLCQFKVKDIQFIYDSHLSNNRYINFNIKSPYNYSEAETYYVTKNQITSFLFHIHYDKMI
jgi:hypothetical protein